MSHSHNHRFHHSAGKCRDRARSDEQGFTCLQCRLYVPCMLDIAGVRNRNHCPGCLWSRHLDWRSAGDRQSGCRARMEPIGLTTKRSRNKYASERDGELMLIHRCTVCAKVVINRIAADDSAAVLLEIFERSHAPSAAFEGGLDDDGVSILTAHDSDLVRRRLFGNGQGHQAA